jgi:hypothetical protein
MNTLPEEVCRSPQGIGGTGLPSPRCVPYLGQCACRNLGYRRNPRLGCGATPSGGAVRHLPELRVPQPPELRGSQPPELRGSQPPELRVPQPPGCGGHNYRVAEVATTVLRRSQLPCCGGRNCRVAGIATAVLRGSQLPCCGCRGYLAQRVGAS